MYTALTEGTLSLPWITRKNPFQSIPSAIPMAAFRLTLFGPRTDTNTTREGYACTSTKHGPRVSLEGARSLSIGIRVLVAFLSEASSSLLPSRLPIVLLLPFPCTHLVLHGVRSSTCALARASSRVSATNSWQWPSCGRSP
eukprot:scaffold348_cov329-Pavlova_lutheri.AAC.28